MVEEDGSTGELLERNLEVRLLPSLSLSSSYKTYEWLGLYAFESMAGEYETNSEQHLFLVTKMKPTLYSTILILSWAEGFSTCSKFVARLDAFRAFANLPGIDFGVGFGAQIGVRIDVFDLDSDF